ncbi:D-lactaldehyde dehydrogenase [Crucibulum laeve]|uniref:D-lactaldehyde dehydrogenase n=1 Tax=Crucibulum laeve TaxID=68775 RepID=A0A5C3M390_9AGAR|nr:D-lactaldehyde dehydrogenase [Crucibulum laeve]
MPTLAPSTNAKVLVTGANGFLAMWIVCRLLKEGYSVRGVVRSAEKGRHAQEYFASYGDRFEIDAVPDMIEEGAFDEAVKGVQAVMHTATPISPSGTDPDAYIKPAVSGAIGILKSALKHGSSIQRIIYTSSTGAVLRPTSDPLVFNENDWNDAALEEVKEKGDSAGWVQKYQASKVLAERAAWELYHTHKHELPWDLVVINPPLILGPAIQEVSTLDSLNLSVKIFYQNVVSEGLRSADTLKEVKVWTDVRDVAEAHVKALHTEAAAGERIIVSAENTSWQEFIDVANTVLPSLSVSISHKITTGIPGLRRNTTFTYDTAKAERILGIRYRSVEQTVGDMLADFGNRGW